MKFKDCKSALTKSSEKGVLQEQYQKVQIEAGNDSFRDKYSEIGLGQSLSQCDQNESKKKPIFSLKFEETQGNETVNNTITNRFPDKNHHVLCENQSIKESSQLKSQYQAGFSKIKLGQVIQDITDMQSESIDLNIDEIILRNESKIKNFMESTDQTTVLN